MSAKKKASKGKDAADPYLESNKDTELEKKVDELMSLEAPSEPEVPVENLVIKPKKSIKVTEHVDEPVTPPPPPQAEPEAELPAPEVLEAPEDSLSTAPLLPGTKATKSKKSIKIVEHVDEPTPEEEPGETPLIPDEALPTEIKIQDEPELNTDAEPEEAEDHEDPEWSKIDEAGEPISLEQEPEQAVSETEPVKTPETQDDLHLEAPSTAKAVDEIIAQDAEDLLQLRDKTGGFSDESLAVPPPTKSTLKPKKQGNPLKRLLKSKRFWKVFIFLLFAGVAIVGAIPSTRYAILNAVGVRASASVTVIDDTTGQPLKNADFSIAGQSAKSDQDGNATVSKIKLGPQKMKVSKAAFGETSKDITVGWGSNPLGDFRLKPVGTQYRVNVTDYLSGKPIAKVEATSGDANARANDKGEIVLTVDRSSLEQKGEIEIEVGSEGYRTEKVTLSLSKTDPQPVQMVPSHKHIFISKRSGKYDVYKTDVDGKNEEKVLAGTGREQPDTMTLVTHPSRNIAALVSMRESTKSKLGNDLISLTIINLDDNKTTQADLSERVQLVGWIDNKLVYVKIAEGENDTSTKRHRLVTYDVNSGTEKELASTNYFNDVLLIGKSIYYSPAAYNVNGSVGLFKTNVDASNKKTVYDKEVWNLFRTSYDGLSVSIGQQWYDLSLSNDVMTPASAAPAVQKTRVYVDGPDANTSLWTEERDGKGVLLSYDKTTKQDKTLRTQSGLKNPLEWLSAKHVVYRVSNGQETADYILNIEGGEPKKIRDVTDTAGIERWYYY